MTQQRRTGHPFQAGWIRRQQSADRTSPPSKNAFWRIDDEHVALLPASHVSRIPMPERHNASPRLTARLRNDPPWQQAVCDRFQIWTVLGGTALSLWPCVRIWTGNWNMPLQNSSPGQQFGTSDAATASTRPIPPDWKLWSTRKHMEHLSASLWAPVEADHHTAKLIRKSGWRSHT